MSIFSLFNRKKATATPQRTLRLRWSESTVSFYTSNFDTYYDEGWLNSSTVFAIVNRIANKAASVPRYQYKVKKGNEKAVTEYKALMSQYDPKAMVEAGRLQRKAMEVVSGNDPINKILKAPNPEMSINQFIYFVIANKLVYGGCPIYGNKGAVGNAILALYPFNNHFIQLVPTPTLLGVQSAKLITNIGGYDLTPENLYIVKFEDIELKQDGSHLYGHSPLKSALRILQSSNQATETQLSMFRFRGKDGVFTPENVETMGMFSDVVIRDEMRTDIDNIMGKENGQATGRKAFVNAMLKYQSFGMDAEELKIIESIQEMDKALCNVYNFPPILLNTEGTTYANMPAARKDLLFECAMPHVQDIDDMFNEFLLPSHGITNGERFIASDYSAMPEAQEDMKLQAEWMAKLGVFTANEVREVTKYEGLALPNMDEPLVSSSMMPISQVGMTDENLDVNIL